MVKGTGSAGLRIFRLLPNHDKEPLPLPIFIHDDDVVRRRDLHLTECTFLLFYRATLCVSAVFAVVRCPSVRLSVTLVHCIHTAEERLCRPGSPIILVC